MREYISFEEAQETVLNTVERVPVERIPLADVPGRTLAEPVTSLEDVPPFDNSAMDGYALRSADVAGAGSTLLCIGEVAAGSAGNIRVESGTCVAIMTGAPIPPGADSVVPVEHTSRVDDGIHFESPVEANANVRRAGEDLRAGELVIEEGRLLTPGAVAVLASLGLAEVVVSREPVVAIVTTGSELVDHTKKPGPGQIRDSNGPALAALVRSAGGRVSALLRTRDDRAAIRQNIERALEADVVIISGGVSVGEYDLVKDVLDELGMELLFWKVRQRPGKPLAFGRIEKTPVFGLPGNPVSSAVCFEKYVRPALTRMLGRSQVRRPLATGRLTAHVTKVEGLYTFARGIGRWRDGELLIDPLPHQGSHVASSMLRANGLVHLPENLKDAPAGLQVGFEWLCS